MALLKLCAECWALLEVFGLFCLVPIKSGTTTVILFRLLPPLLWQQKSRKNWRGQQQEVTSATFTVKLKSVFKSTGLCEQGHSTELPCFSPLFLSEAFPVLRKDQEEEP